MRFRAAALAAFLLSLPLLFPALARAETGAAVPHAQKDDAPVVDIIEISGLIDPPMAEYIADEIREANKEKAELLVISISSDGGLNTRTESLLRLIEASRVPVAVYVGPQRAVAGGSAAVLTAAAHIAAIGPSARLGPAHPTNLAVKADSDRGRALRTATLEQLNELAAARGRAPAIYLDEAIPASVALDRRQVDYTVVSVAELLQRANGREVTTAAGSRTLNLDKDAVDIRFHKPGPWPRVLHTLANASLVYILLVAGALLIAFELFQPGFGVAGVTGALLLVGGVYGLTVLPSSLWAVIALTGGTILMTLDVKLDGLGVPTAVGAVAFSAGSFGLFPGPAAPLRIAWWLALLGVVSALVFFVPVMTLVRRARQPVRKNADASLVGQAGQVRSILNPEGYVWVADALWRARADEGERIRVGEDVLVTGLEGTLLRVRRA
ncbi:MAG TPA: NfeD family protein [Actinomycetota bacterium]|nr:NfeD family protein [Actinomycetota bacterium]